jgi:hypothetical protein
MPRYFFHVEDGLYLVDDIGKDLAGLDEARDEAIRLSGLALAAKGRALWDKDQWRIWVTDDRDGALFSIQFKVEKAAAALARFPSLFPEAA